MTKGQNSLLKVKAVLFVLMMAVYVFFSSGTPWLEADTQLKLARNVLKAHSLLADTPFNERAIYRNAGGKFYDIHGISNVILMLPIAALENAARGRVSDTERFLTFAGAMTGTVVNSLVCLAFFSILALFGRPLKVCVYSTLSLAFLTIVFPYATKNYEGNLSTLFVMGALYYLFKFLKAGNTRHLLLCGVLAGLAVNTRDFSWISFLCVGIFLAWYSFARRNVMPALYFLAGAAPFVMLWGWYNWTRTGIFYVPPTLFGSIRLGDFENFVNVIDMTPLWGLLFSPGGSIFLYSPILVISLLGIRKFLRLQRQEAVLVLSIIALFILANAKLNDLWFGLWCWGPRFTLEITPLMLLPLAYWLSGDDFRSRIKKRIFIIACMYSFLIQAAATLTNWHGRLRYLLDRKGAREFLFTAQYSQWWDSVKTLLINFWNLLFGAFKYINNPGHDLKMSEATMYTSNTLFTWWNRLLFEGASPALVWAYLAITAAVIAACWLNLLSYIRKENAARGSI